MPEKMTATDSRPPKGGRLHSLVNSPVHSNEEPEEDIAYYEDDERRVWMDDKYPVCANCESWEFDPDGDYVADPLGTKKLCEKHKKETHKNDKCRHFNLCVEES